MQEHKEWLDQAIEMAVENTAAGGGPFAALVVKDGQIVGKGVNCTHHTNDPTAHAELLAIREACIHLGRPMISDCVVYASGEPCPMCMGAIYWAKPKAVYYACGKSEASEAVSFPDPLSNFYEDAARQPETRRVPVYKLDVERRLAPFRAWQNQANRG